jgi:hypothetical protein
MKTEPGQLSVAKSMTNIQRMPYLDLIPVLPGEGILSLLLETLLALRKALVPEYMSEIASKGVRAARCEELMVG